MKNTSLQTKKQNLNHLIDPSFQKLNRLSVLSFENKDDRTVHTYHYCPTVEINDNVMIDGKKNLSASR